MKTKISKYMDIKRIEFIVTWECGGKCKHCQMGDNINKPGTHRHVLAENAVEAVKKLSKVFDITSVMTFGGEPLYYPEVTAAIHKAATECGIETREVITNGYFTNSAEKSASVAKALSDAGVNHLPISVDAFHQEHIPIEPVYQFVRDVINAKIPDAFLHTAWLVNEEHENPYNTKTREILEKFSDLPIPVGKHGGVGPSGYAAKYLREYFTETIDSELENCGPCSAPLNVTCISIEPSGDVGVCGGTIGNIYEEDILNIIARYNPYEHESMLALIKGGVSGLLEYAKTQGVVIDTSEYCEACWSLCAAVSKRLKSQSRSE